MSATPSMCTASRRTRAASRTRSAASSTPPSRRIEAGGPGCASPRSSPRPRQRPRQLKRPRRPLDPGPLARLRSQEGVKEALRGRPRPQTRAFPAARHRCCYASGRSGRRPSWEPVELRVVPRAAFPGLAGGGAPAGGKGPGPDGARTLCSLCSAPAIASSWMPSAKLRTAATAASRAASSCFSSSYAC